MEQGGTGGSSANANTAGNAGVTETGGASLGGANGGVSSGGSSASGAPSGGAASGAPSGGATHVETSLFVPPDLAHAVIAGEDTALTLVALTVVKGPSGGTELYAAVRNLGPTPICEPGMLIDFFDAAGTELASAGIPLQSAQFYALADGTVIRCVDPTEIAMGGTTNLPAELTLAELDHLEYAFPAFDVGDITLAAGPSVTNLQPVKTLDGTSYSGTFSNGVYTAASAAVSVFPVSAVGRPVGMATASAGAPVEPGGTWAFQTDTVRDPGVAQVVYPNN